MIISIWRYSHLALAISSFFFVLILSITGAILAFEPVSDALYQYPSVKDYEDKTLAQTLHTLKLKYDQVLDLSIDESGLMSVSVISKEGDKGHFYVDPTSGEKVGDLIEKTALFKFATNLHRSLFLKAPGRFFVGLSSFLLFLITVSGCILLIKRQQGIKHFFSKIIKETFFQYFHIYTSRLALLPLILITLTGVYLSLLRFSIIPDSVLSHSTDFENTAISPQVNVGDFAVFHRTHLSDIRSLSFPFFEDPSEYYQLNLRNKEVLVNQFTGEILSEKPYPFTRIVSNWSFILHTGKGYWIWSIILGISSLSILFFMYSGFAMTLKRRASRIKNKHLAKESEYVILVGSETGTTMAFAKLFHQQLLKAGKRSFMAELNDVKLYPKMEHLILFTATYGQGEAPTNAKKFLERVNAMQLKKSFSFSVLGFGSLSYPNFCAYAQDVDKILNDLEKSKRLLELYTINNRSWAAFKEWTKAWSTAMDLSISVPKEDAFTQKSKQKQLFKVVKNTVRNDTYLLQLESPKTTPFSSGDLLAVYPDDGSHERLYSIGRLSNSQLLIGVKRHDKGICSHYLASLKEGDTVKTHLRKNKDFHFPKSAKQVLMISSGTGIVPFLGMLNKNDKRIETHLYWGAKNKEALELYQKWIEENISKKHLHHFKPAYSREESHKTYVQDLLEKDETLVSNLFENNGVVMICGSIAMQKGVTKILDEICLKLNRKPLSFYQNKGQLKMDCY